MYCVQNKTWQNKCLVKMTITGHTKDYSCYFDCGVDGLCGGQRTTCTSNSSVHHVCPEDQTQDIKSVDN